MTNQQIETELKAIIDNFPNDLRQKTIDWLQWDKNVKTRQDIVDLIKAKDVEKLSKKLLTRQSFGTAGIRAIMEAGFNGLNDLVIIQTSQGLAKYLAILAGPDRVQWSKNVVIGYDGRYNSYRFAKLTARAMLQCGFKVYLFSKVVPTPFIPFTIGLLQSAAGVMVTASHNPKEYNGYKVYLDKGTQILSPHDQNIQSHILESLVPWNEKMWNTDSLTYESEPNMIDPLEKVMEEYYRALVQSATQTNIVADSNLRVVYTGLHGVGHDYLTEAFKRLNFKNYFPVLSQKDPDPEFPTVVFPNPEEGQGVLDEAMKTAAESNSSLIIVNDPDSDRTAAAELNGNEWRVFNGNEIGALLGWWLWHQFRGNPANSSVPNTECYMISSAVSSKILETISKKEGFNWCETLTGFKWMGNEGFTLHGQGKRVLLAFEEAIGFMVGTNVFDKDGISGAATMLQMAAYLHSKKSSLLAQLNQIYRTYGFHFSINSYYICHDPDKTNRIFNRIADLNGPNTYINEVNGIKVVRVRDLNRGYDSSTSDKKPVLPTSSSSFMLTLYFENGSVITFRTSGTEPKIKYYSEMIADPSEQNWEDIKERHKKLIQAVVQVVLEPEKNQIQAKKE